ncbi:MAG: hypothetical protein CMD23_00620 [Flavobacteriales bacterium]|nr:hypothetical protein [Flavobacteriales bacterium]|tara:strand:+ start:4479 stop:5822 length:1344 start_codon:yes stop_codon:yes gene_type:complete
MKKILDIKNLSIVYSKIDNTNRNFFMKLFLDKKRTYSLLRSVNLSVFEGEYLGLVGESGCGKSLTMKTIFGMIDFDPGVVSGEVVINDIKNNKKISILNTNNRKLINKYLSNTYFSENHIEVKDSKVTFPNNLDINKDSIFYLYNDNGDSKEVIMNDSAISRTYKLSKNEKIFSYCFILCKKIIPVDNKNNIKDILISSKKNNIPGKFISIILQDPLSFMNPYWSMLRQMNNLKNLHPSKDVNDIDEILSNVKLNDQSFKNALPRELSGGQGQRAMIVLSSLTKPKLLIADEPTTGLDVTLKKIVVEKFKDLKNKISDKFSMIFISHDLNMVRKATTRMNVMYKGQIIENGLSKDFTSKNKHHPYTKKLINITKSNFSSETISSNQVSGDKSFGGCSYYAVCEHKSKNNLCSKLTPPAIKIEDGKILINEDPTISWVKCWSFLKEQK